MNYIYGIILCIIFIISFAFFILQRSKYQIILLKIINKFLHKKNVEYYKKNISFITLTTLALSFIGLIYIAIGSSNNATKLSSLNRPVGDGTSINTTLMVESDLYSGPIDIPIKNREYTFDEAMEIFNSYREQLDSYVLGDNISFLKIVTPIMLPTSIGDENISITWHIEDPNILAYSGKPVSENLTDDGSETELIATLTLGNHSAEIYYFIKVYPCEEDDKSRIEALINDYINSPTNRSNTTVNLPNEIDGHTIYFYENKSVLPS